MRTTIFIMASALLFAACGAESESVTNSDGPVEAQITAGVSTVGLQTRADGDKWEQDVIGVMVTGASEGNGMATLYKNVKYSTTSTSTGTTNFTAETGKGIFFQDASETVTFAAYGPYQAAADNNNATLPGTNGVITSSTEKQNSRDSQKAFDYIYASGATAKRAEPTVSFSGNNKFNHKMSRLIIEIVPGTDQGVSSSEVTGGKYTLGGLKHSGTFNVTTGVAAAIGEATNDWSLDDNSLKNADQSTGKVTFTSILYPQTLASALTFSASIGGQTFSNSDGIKPALEAGNSYTYTITIKKTGIVISGSEVSDWTENAAQDIDAIMQQN